MASSTPLKGAVTIPRFVVLRPKLLENSYVSYKDGRVVIDEEEGVFSPLVKIEVETAKRVEAGLTLVHLRFCHSNKYMGRREGIEFPVAELMQPEEDMEKRTSTLFILLNGAAGRADEYYMDHMQSGTCPQLNEARDELVFKEWSDIDELKFELVDWDTLVKLPTHVAFKGVNGRYLVGSWIEGYQYLHFDSPDPNREDAGHEVELLRNGYAKIKCLHFSGRYWRNCINWIWADSWDSSTTDKSLLFWPVRLDANTIALRSTLNNNFCASLTTEGKESCLNAATSTISADARLVVQELVLERKISNVTYRMEDARISKENPFMAGTTSAVNNSEKDETISVALGYKVTKSDTFSNSVTVTAGLTASIEVALVPEIVKGTIGLSVERSGTWQWGKTITHEDTITATGTVIVPPRKKAIVNYVGTRGTCNVPYSYRRQDKSSTDGKIVYTNEIDGVYIGVNAYNFSFEVQKYENL